MAQTSLNSTGVASTGALSLQSNGTTEAIGISTGQVATLAQNPILTSGTANGVGYLNASKVLTTGSALTFDGTNFGVGTSQPVGDSGWANFTLKGTNGGEFWFQDSTGTGTYTSSQGYIGTNSTDFKMMAFGSGRTLMFGVNNAEQMRLTSTGLGIGTSLGSRKLNVAGAIGIGISSETGVGWRSADFSGSYGEISVDTSSVMRFYAPSLSMTLASGNLGLGVTPSAWSTGKALEINTVGNSIWGLSDQLNIANNAYYNAGWKYAGTGLAVTYQQNAGKHVWSTAASGTAGNAITFTQAMTLDASGNLLVGKTAANYQTVGFEADANGITYCTYSTASAGSGYALGVNRKTSTGDLVDFFYNNGVVGSISTNGTLTVYNTTSDYRLKNVIGAVSGSGERIDALEPVEYTWKADGSHTRGFLAHKFQEVYAGSVTGTKDAVDEEGKPVYQAMQASSSEVIADLVAEIQSLRKRLAAAGI